MYSYVYMIKSTGTVGHVLACMKMYIAFTCVDGHRHAHSFTSFLLLSYMTLCTVARFIDNVKENKIISSLFTPPSHTAGYTVLFSFILYRS